MTPFKGLDLCTLQPENVCSVARADRSRARKEWLVGRRTLVLVAPEGEDTDGRKQLAKGLI